MNWNEINAIAASIRTESGGHAGFERYALSILEESEFPTPELTALARAYAPLVRRLLHR